MMKNRLKLNQYTNGILRIVSAIIIVGIIVLLLLFYIISRPAYQSIRTSVVNSHLDIGDIQLDATAPLYLNGEWDYFPGVYIGTSSFDRAVLDAPEQISLPLSDMDEAKGRATYRMFLSLKQLPQTGLIFYIPTPRNNINVYLNGQQLPSSSLNKNWLNYSQRHSLFYIDQIDSQREYQEIVVSSDGADGSLGIFQRDLAISTFSNIITLIMVATGYETLIVGMLLIMLISSFIFMLLRPNHKMITAMTLFDSLLMLRIIFGLNYFLMLVSSILSDEILSDRLCYSIKLFFLCVAGIAGIKLSHDLYDEEGKTPKILTIPPAILYLLIGVIFPFYPELFAGIGVPLLLLNYLYTFVGVGWQSILCLQRGLKPYYILQIIKTILVGLIVFADIVLWDADYDFLLMVLLYSLYFIVHIWFRLYDNNISYRQVEVFNRDLECTVIRRTQELEDANRRLEEISIRDPLTHAYNRLHFERISKEFLDRHKQTGEMLYLAIFDLDFFKQVNDTYGHDEGDRQLIFAVECYTQIALPGSVLSRIGGEEFTVLFLGSTGEQVLQWSETLRKAFENSALEDPKKTTISVGVVQYLPGMDNAAFFKQADTCLYSAKNSGRNRVCYQFDSQIATITGPVDPRTNFVRI